MSKINMPNPVNYLDVKPNDHLGYFKSTVLTEDTGICW